MNVQSFNSDMKTNNLNCDSENKLTSCTSNIACFQEDTVAKSMPVNFSPAKFAFFYNDMNNVVSTEPHSNNTLDRERFKSDKASFFRTDVLLSPKYRGKVNLFDSSFEDFETQLTKIDSVPIKSDESLDDITEKRNSSDLSSQDTGSTLSAEIGSLSNTPDHSIFTLVSPSKFVSRKKYNRLSVSSDSKVELMKSSRAGENQEEEDDIEVTPTSQSFHDISEEILEKSGKDMAHCNLKKDSKYSTVGTFTLDKESPDEIDNSFYLRKIDKLKNIRTGNLYNRFSKSQETYQLQSDVDDVSDPDASRKEDFDDESVAISLDPMDCNYDSTSLMSDSMDNFTVTTNPEALQQESEFSNKSASLSSDDTDEDDFISGDLVCFIRNFDRQTTRDGRYQDGKGIKLGVEKIPNDDEFILGNSVQTKKKYFKKSFQLSMEDRHSPTKHQNGCKSDRCILSCQPGSLGNIESSPTSPLKKYTAVLSKNISLKAPLPMLTLPHDVEFDTNYPESVEEVESSKTILKAGVSPISPNRITTMSPESRVIEDEQRSNSDKEDHNEAVQMQDRNDSEINQGSNDLHEFPAGLTASQRMLLVDFRVGSQRGSRERERPAAARLAKRLYYLHGFKRSDITRHLSKRNSFALLVGEEFLKYFDFSGERLDDSLRIFLKNLAFIQEIPCDKDRIMQHFAHRYVECNPGRFENEAFIHSLAYALLALDNDLNNQTSLQKVTSQDFVENFIESQQNAGVDIPDPLTRDFLHQLYQSIKNEPLELQIEEVLPAIQQPSQQRGPALPVSQTTPQSFNNSSLVVDTSSSSVGRNGIQVMNALEKNALSDSEDQLELKKGYIMRKCCLDANGRKTGLGRRGWKMFYAVLRDTTLFLYSNERASKSKKSYLARSTTASTKSSFQANSEGNVSTPKKSIGYSLKDKVLGRLSRKGKTGSQESGIANIVSGDEEEDNGQSIPIGIGDDLEDESLVLESDNEGQPKLDTLERKHNTLPREQGSRHVPVGNGSNTICLLHSLATKATDYIKKSHVFRLHTVDRAQYLIQTSDVKECQDWMDCINVVAALNSAPIPNRDFNIHKWFDRPITNLECSVLSIREQILQHERAAAQYEKQLVEYRRIAPEKGSRSRVIRDYCHKENFLKFEIKRFKVYTKLLQYQLSTCPQLEPSLAETTIGEVEEPSCSPVTDAPANLFDTPVDSASNRDEIQLISQAIQGKNDSTDYSTTSDLNVIMKCESIEKESFVFPDSTTAEILISPTLQCNTKSSAVPTTESPTAPDIASESTITTQVCATGKSVMVS